jgi:hypothetical protein
MGNKNIGIVEQDITLKGTNQLITRNKAIICEEQQYGDHGSEKHECTRNHQNHEGTNRI